MKYLIRAIKYFFYLLIILTLILSALVLTNFVEADIQAMFRNGYDSLWQIAACTAFFALLYPRFGFGHRMAHLYGDPAQTRPAVMKIMENRGYKLETEDGEVMTFIRTSAITRLIKMYEDRITLTRSAAGYDVEGLTKDIVRVVTALEATQEDA